MHVGGMNSRGASHICTQLAKQCTYASLTPLVLSLGPWLNEVPSWLSLLSPIIRLVYLFNKCTKSPWYSQAGIEHGEESHSQWGEGPEGQTDKPASS